MTLPATYHIHLKGMVQGVGFRPYVYRLAQEQGLKGWVQNAPDGVHIELNASPERARQFFEKILSDAPSLAQITDRSLREIPGKFFDTFAIVHSETGAHADLMLTPDFGLCADCRRELHTASDRRFGYPFITCVNCGPRFSIVEGLPYDRPLTSMRDFRMCPGCAAEYGNPFDRRYFSQTNSCPVCGIRLFFEDFAKNEVIDNQEQAIERTLDALRSGQITAVKGIGGYLLLCDATDAEAVQTLRHRKHRPSKPFAVLYPDLDILGSDAIVRPQEAALLTGPVSPIVLLRLRDRPATGLATALTAPGLGHIGAMLPYAPLLDVLAGAFGKPLIATSGNRGGSPIVFDDISARNDLGAVADALLGHSRRIAAPQDDSVVRLTERCKQPIIVRRSRGLAPSLLVEGFQPPHKTVFCAGADLKSAFAWAQGGNAYVSPYLGDLESYDTQENYRRMVAHFAALMGTAPEIVIADRHPGYFSTQIARAMAEQWKVRWVQVQHHEAHFAAVLAENGLIHVKNPVLGVIWDGTGFGDETHAWGGEFFLWQHKKIRRTAWWDDFPMPTGDKMAREPRLAALAIAHDLDGGEQLLQPKFNNQEWLFYQKLLKNGTRVRTSSMGRIFDAAASLLGLADRNTYEGEAAMLLENLAVRGDFSQNVFISNDCFSDCYTVNTRLFFQNIILALRKKRAPNDIAAGIHLNLTEIVRSVAMSRNVKDIAFSGGVFQNALLVDLLIERLSGDFRLHFHRQLSPNDECIAFGQLVMRECVAVDQNDAV